MVWVRWRERPRRRARVAATEPALRGGTADGEKMVNKRHDLIRSHASMNKQKKTKT